jgi:hypothetical protein
VCRQVALGRIKAVRVDAAPPTPDRALLKTKVKVQFEKPVKRLSTPPFPVFQGSNQAQFQPVFFVFTVRSAEGRNGRGWLRFSGLIASGPLLAACFQRPCARRRSHTLADYPYRINSEKGQCT